MTYNSKTFDQKSSPIHTQVKIGDLVELLGDGEFFQRGDDESERYSGYIALMTDRVVGISTTHHENMHHGYVPGKERPERKITEIEVGHFIRYTIFREE